MGYLDSFSKYLEQDCQPEGCWRGVLQLYGLAPVPQLNCEGTT